MRLESQTSQTESEALQAEFYLGMAQPFLTVAFLVAVVVYEYGKKKTSSRLPPNAKGLF